MSDKKTATTTGPDDLLTMKEAAEILRVSWQTVQKYGVTGRLPRVNIGRKVFHRREDVEHARREGIPDPDDGPYLSEA